MKNSREIYLSYMWIIDVNDDTTSKNERDMKEDTSMTR